MLIKYKGILLRLVDDVDASFIVSLRNDKKKSKFISKSSPDIDAQKLWISEYKTRERQKKEFYFIATDENGEDFATYRIYKIDSGLPEIGSWVSKPNYLKAKNSIKVDIAIKNYILNELNFDNIQFEVRKENLSVNNYHKLFHPNLINTDENNNYYILKKQSFNAVIQDILNKFKI